MRKTIFGALVALALTATAAFSASYWNVTIEHVDETTNPPRIGFSLDGSWHPPMLLEDLFWADCNDQTVADQAKSLIGEEVILIDKIENDGSGQDGDIDEIHVPGE